MQCMPQIDKYLYSTDNYVVAGGFNRCSIQGRLLEEAQQSRSTSQAVGIINTCVQVMLTLPL